MNIIKYVKWNVCKYVKDCTLSWKLHIISSFMTLSFLFTDGISASTQLMFLKHFSRWRHFVSINCKWFLIMSFLADYFMFNYIIELSPILHHCMILLRHSRRKRNSRIRNPDLHSYMVEMSFLDISHPFNVFLQILMII